MSIILSPILRPESLLTSPFLTIPIPVVDIISLSSLSCSITLVSPVIIATSTSLHTASMDIIIFSKSLIENPSLITIAFAIAIGFAPIIDTSLTVPAMDMVPMSPPGKNMGSIV